MTTDLHDKIAARQALLPLPLRQPTREAVGVSRVELAAEIARLIREATGDDDASCTAQAVLYWETGRREPRGQYLLAYSRVLQSLREIADRSLRAAQ